MNPLYPRAVWRVLLDGKDLAPALNPRLISLSIRECRGDEADQLDITLSDHDGLLEIPPLGAVLAVSIGWSHIGLVDKGTFTVDELTHSGTPDIITLRGRSADMTSPLRTRTERSFHKKTVKEIVEAVAADHGLTPVVDPMFAKIKVEHIDQTNESDLAFLNRIGKRYDAVANVKDGRLVFLVITGARTQNGQQMPLLELLRSDGDSHNFQQVGRDSYTGVKAMWLDTRKSKKRSVVVGVLGNAKHLRETYANETDALQAAQAEWQRIRRGTASMKFSMAVSRPEMTPQYRVKFMNMKPPIREIEWLVKNLEHSLDGSGGLRLTLDLDIQEAEEPEGEEENR